MAKTWPEVKKWLEAEHAKVTEVVNTDAGFLIKIRRRQGIKYHKTVLTTPRFDYYSDSTSQTIDNFDVVRVAGELGLSAAPFLDASAARSIGIYEEILSQNEEVSAFSKKMFDSEEITQRDLDRLAEDLSRLLEEAEGRLI